MHSNQFIIKLYREKKFESHLHPEPELIYVVSGYVTVGIKDKRYVLSKEDVIFVNSSLQHSIVCDEGAVYCSMKFDYQVLVHILKKPNSFFVCNSAEDRMQMYTEIRRLCWEMVYYEVCAQKQTDSMKYSLMYQILDLLIEHYLPSDNNPMISENHDANEKLQTIIHYVHQNYQDGISLSDLAKEMYTSTSTLSRLFKKQTGTYFAEYVNQVRIRYAVDELLYTEKNMTKIAMDCGFSNASAFTKVFREIYFMAPTEYRQKMRETGELQEDDQTGLRQEILVSMQDTMENRYGSQSLEEIKKNDESFVEMSVEKTYRINALETREYRKSWNRAINMGAIFDMTKANVQYHLQYLVQELGFEYVRIWSLFSKQMHISDGESVGKFNFDLVDEVLDFLVSIHIHPWFDLVRRPNANVRSEHDVVWFEDDNIPFASRRVWESVFEGFLKHCVRRYGLPEVSQWIFELGEDQFHTDDALFYRDEGYRFEDVFAFAYGKVREIVPGGKIGYTTGPPNITDHTFVDKFTRMKLSDLSPDFVAFLLFPYLPGDGESGAEVPDMVRVFDRDFESRQIQRAKGLLAQCGFEEMPIYISEWNITVSTRNFLNDSMFRGACFCKKVEEIGESVDMLALWVGSDWISNYFDARFVVSGSGGILTKDRIRKPVFFALHLMNRLGNELMSSGEHFIATKTAVNEYEIICFNVNWFGSSYFLKAEDESMPDDINEDIDIGGPVSVSLELEGVCENCEYVIKRRTISREHGSILDAWKEFDYSDTLGRNDIKYLQEVCVPSLGMSRLRARRDKLKLSVFLQPQEITSLHIYLAD